MAGVGCRSGTDCVLNVEERSRRDYRLQLGIVRIAPLRNPARQNRESERIAAEWIRVHRKLALPGSGWAHFPIHFTPVVVHGHAFNGGIFGAAKAEIQREAIQSFQTLHVGLDELLVGERFRRRVVSQIYFNPQLLEAQALHKIIGHVLLLRLHVLCRVSGNGGARAIVEAHTVRNHQQAGIQVGFHHAIDSALIQENVLLGWDGHEAVRSEGARVHARGQFPFLPAIVVLGGGQTEGTERFWTGEDLIAPFPRKKTGKKGVVGLTNDDDGVSLLKNQSWPYGPYADRVPSLSTERRPVSSATTQQCRAARIEGMVFLLIEKKQRRATGGGYLNNEFCQAWLTRHEIPPAPRLSSFEPWARGAASESVSILRR